MNVSTVIKLLPVAALFALAAPLAAEQIRVEARVGKRSVYVGQKFVYQVIVRGASPDQKPDLSAIKNFKVEFERDLPQRSSSMMIINGRVQRRDNITHVFQYQL